MRESSWEDPQIALTYVADKHGSIRIHYSNAGISIEHVGPLISGVPVHFTITACGEAHVHSGNIFGRRENPLRYFVGPSTLFDSLFDQVE